jgi:ribosome modulation factor
MSKESEYTKGYKRGVKGESFSSSWGDIVDDGLFNEKGSKQARSDGYQAGLRDRARDQAQNKGKK